ncbi:AMP-binding protein [Candidatus Sumerlaeota bacterium]|nr:AMP-binding protein [Candidatus Sumerlaeota bacterium]
MHHSYQKYTNVSAHLPRMAAEVPEMPAVTVQHGAAAFESWNFAELNAESNRMAVALTGIGVTPGMRTALMVRPGLEFFSLAFALLKIGAAPVFIDPGIGKQGLKDCLDRARPEAFIGITRAHAARVLLHWAEASVEINVTVGPRLFWGGESYEALRARTPIPVEGFPVYQPQPDETAAILFTSGSTGSPKGAVYTHAIFAEQVEALRMMFGIEPGEQDVSTFPLFALFGPALGMGAIIPDMDASRPAQANPSRIINAANLRGATNLYASPALLAKLARYGQHTERLPTLRRVISAGAPAEPQMLRALSRMLPRDAQIHTPYGATECLPVSVIGSREILEQTAALTEQGKGVCVGRPVFPDSVRIIRITDEPIDAWSDELVLSQGQIGEIAVKSPVASAEYFDQPDKTRQAKIPTTNGGFYHRMGDVGYFDEQGRLWYCGRKSHRVRTASGDLFTIPVERIFNKHALVRRTALVGIRDGREERNGLQRPVLCVEPARKLNPIERRTLSGDLWQLAQQTPLARELYRIRLHHGFPMDVRHNSKIFREKLAAWAQEQEDDEKR